MRWILLQRPGGEIPPTVRSVISEVQEALLREPERQALAELRALIAGD